MRTADGRVTRCGPDGITAPGATGVDHEAVAATRRRLSVSFVGQPLPVLLVGEAPPAWAGGALAGPSSYCFDRVTTPQSFLAPLSPVARVIASGPAEL